jgi:hypothetical protein
VEQHVAEWEIKKTLGLCYGTNRQLTVGEEYYAALVQTEEGLLRRDFSAACWEAQKPQVFCFWKSHVPNPQLKPKLFIDDAMLMAFFDRLATETDQEKINFRFVLILMRKRKLKYDSSRNEEGREIWMLRVVGEDRTEEVVNPNLSEDQIGQLSEQMGQILQTSLE